MAGALDVCPSVSRVRTEVPHADDVGIGWPGSQGELHPTFPHLLCTPGAHAPLQSYPVEALQDPWVAATDRERSAASGREGRRDSIREEKVGVLACPTLKEVLELDTGSRVC